MLVDACGVQNADSFHETVGHAMFNDLFRKHIYMFFFFFFYYTRVTRALPIPIDRARIVLARVRTMEFVLLLTIPPITGGIDGWSTVGRVYKQFIRRDDTVIEFQFDAEKYRWPSKMQTVSFKLQYTFF